MLPSERLLVALLVFLPVLVLAAASLLSGCASGELGPIRDFAGECGFLETNADLVLLRGPEGQCVAVSPSLQGRIMTSSLRGKKGLSFGWINRDMIRKGEDPHFRNYGGEDRMWLGPEGGQFSLYFPPGVPQVFEHWKVPAALDEGPYDVADESATKVVLKRRMNLENYSGTKFDLEVTREISLLDRPRTEEVLGAGIPQGVRFVAYQSLNRVKNAGTAKHSKETGLVSIWMLGQFNPSEDAIVIAPFAAGDEKELGPVANTKYFGEIPPNRFRVGKGFLGFRVDGQYRSKIGISRARAKEVIGSIDYENDVLTIVKFDLPPDRDYVNSMWEVPQKEPFRGDVINSYNDGPPEPGMKAMGGFYELETSSPARELDPGAAIEHVHRTFHFQGDLDSLNRISKAALGIDLLEVRKLF